MSESKPASERPWKAMLQTGVACHGEILIERRIEDVWRVIPEYYKWVPEHRLGSRRTIKGEPGRVGEVVEILKAGAEQPVYAETIRIRPLEIIEGTYKSANIVWKVYDRDVSFSRFSDFGVREYCGKTIFCRSMFDQWIPSSEQFVRSRRDLAEGRDSLANAMPMLRDLIEEYLRIDE